MVFEYIRHGSKTGSDGFSLSIVQGRTTPYTVNRLPETNTSSRRNAIALSSSPFLLISTCVLSIRMVPIDTPKSTVCSNVTSSPQSFFLPFCPTPLRKTCCQETLRSFFVEFADRSPSFQTTIFVIIGEYERKKKEKEEEEEEEDAFNPLLCRRRYRPSLRPRS